ncbi:MAG: signal peptidase I [Clostridia bacterium]|nr:signal peptidase I [Clostridia bacterium]
MYKVNKINKEDTRIHIAMKILSIILYIVLIPIIIFNLTLIFKSFINPDKTPDFFGLKSYIIVSGSMEPTIHVGDAIFVKELNKEKIKVNDIISFKDGDSITTHRIVRIEEKNGITKYATKGDNNNSEDKEKVTYSQIEGVYKFKINGFGIVIKILKSKITLLILIIVILLNYWYNSRINNKKKERKEKRMKYKKEGLHK